MLGAGESLTRQDEEAWFLMQTRWMLWNEITRFARSVSCRWFLVLGSRLGKKIKLEKSAATSAFSLNVQTIGFPDMVEATIEFQELLKSAPSW